MFTSSELERFSMQLDEPMSKLEMRIMEDIVRRIRENGEITRAADWQINRLYQLGMSQDEIDAAIAQALGLTEEDMEALYSDIISKGYARDKRLYDKTGTPFIPFEENDELRQLISSVAAQTSESLENITQSLGFAIKQNGAVSFLPIAKYYQRTLDSAMLDIASGAFDYNTVLKRVISELTNSGLRTVDYATGHSNRVEVAARRALQTGIGQLTDKVNNDNAEELGTDWFEVTVSRCARPTHAVWQGRVLRSADLVRVCGLGRVDGLCGANCYHDKHPFIPGISERAYTDEELSELARQENTPREWNGKKYTAYEASQRQRSLETTMRAQRQKIKLLEEAGASEDELVAARARYRVTSAEYSRFSQAMGIPQQRERVTVDGLGAIGNKKAIDKSQESGIIKNIELTDITNATASGKISEEVSKAIFDTLSIDDSQRLFDSVKVINVDPKIVMQTDPVRKGSFFDTELNLNENFLGGKTVAQLDEEIKSSNVTVANSLKEAVIHEKYHAMLINGLNQAELESLYDELSEMHIVGVSPTAAKDGAECIAEIGVLYERGDTDWLPQKAIDLFNQHIGGIV